MSRFTSFPFHVLLVPAYAVLFFYGRNLWEADATEAFILALATIGAAALLLALVGRMLGDMHKAGLVVSLAGTSIFGYGHLVNVLAHRFAGPEALVMVAVLSITIAACWRVIRSRSPIWTTQAMNYVLLALVVIAAVPVARHPGHADLALAAPSVPHPPGAASATGIDPGRDIYYVVFDRYGRADTFAEQFGFDNEPFLEGLRERGFYVAADSHANHLQSAQSLLSSLNMSYLQELADAYGEDTDDWSVVFDALQEPNAVGRFVTAQGYAYVNVGSWWSPTADNLLATHNVGYEASSAFVRGFVATTIFARLFERLGVLGSVSRRRAHVDAATTQLAALHHMDDVPGRKFVFAHVLLPHDPYVFDRDGNVLSDADQEGKSRDEQFVEQLRYTNRLIDDLLDTLLVGPDEQHPIIVISADEGPHPHRFSADREAFQWPEATDTELQRKFRIIHALYLPGLGEPPLYPGLSPVNTFRLIFNEYFGAAFPLLDDRSYVHRNAQRPFDYTDITERLRS